MTSESLELERAESGAVAAVPHGALDRSAPDLARAGETPGILQLAWPAVLGNLAFSMVGLVDMKIVGALGPSAVAAVATGNRIFFVIQAFMIAASTGTTAMVARAWGAGDRVEAERVTQASLWVCGAVAIAVAGNSASITVVDLASVNAIGFGALNVNNGFLAPLTLAWTVVADGTTEQYDCRLFLPSYSGVGNLLTVRNAGNTRVQISPCQITAPPC